MPKTVKRIFAILGFLGFVMLLSVTDALADDSATATYGTPQLGSNDPLWQETMAHVIGQSTVPDDARPHATGIARILWDEDYVYVRVEVEDEDVYEGPGADHMYDSIEFYFGSGNNGGNQWRISSTGIWSGQNAQGRAGWTKVTEDGYIVEARLPKRTVDLAEGPLTFDVYINNSSANGGDRYEVVSAFGTPDAGYSSSASFENSLTLIGADVVDARHSITATAGTGGSISPTVPGNIFRVVEGEDITFVFTPDSGQVIDTVTVDGEEVTVSEDNSYTIKNVGANHLIHATFQYDPGAEMFNFIVWNDNFAKGEYTTAVIIDLGEGNAVNGSDLSPDMFVVSAQNTTLDGNTPTLTENRNITRVYANDKPEVRGYQGVVSNSPDYQGGLESGRYIVIELEFFTSAGGAITLDGNQNSTLQIYNVVQTEAIPLTDDGSLNNVVFVQEDVVNPILDRFVTYSDNGVNRSVYLHKNGNGETVEELPLYVYIHGMGRGGTSSDIDQKAAMKSPNGAVALMQRMNENPNKYASHVLNISYNGTSTPSTDAVKAVIDDLVASGAVDSNRIYVAGFSWGGAYTNTLLNAYPGFFAAGAPMSPVFGSPEAASNDAHADLAYWMFVNSYDGDSYQSNFNNFVANNLPEMTNARGSLFDSNKSFIWPYNQFDQPEQNPPLPAWLAHEVEAAVLYNNIHENGWDIAPVAGTLDSRYTNVFDWMFAQSLEGEMVDEPDPEEPVDPADVIKDLEEQVRDLTERLEDLENLSAEEREELKGILAELRAEIAELQANEETLLDVITALLSRIEALENRVSELEEAEEGGTTPDGENPEDPADPTDPKDPVLVDPKPTNPDSTATDKTETGGSGTLPATATNQFSIMLIGLALLVVGAITAVIVRKKARKSE